MKFDELNLNTLLLRGIKDTGFKECLPVQASTLPVTLDGKDVTVQSQTGTGKTAAFLITIFERLLQDSRIKGKKALIVVPTRELAVQIEKDARAIGAHLPFVMGCFYGGVGYQKQESLIRRNVDIIIGTPGRLLDLNGSGKLSFKDVAILVIDEADRLFDMGFLPDIRRMMRRMMPPQHRQTMLFSATLGYQARSISREFMDHPTKIEIQPEKVTVDKITQLMYHVGHREKVALLLGLLKRDNPANTLIFTNTKHMAEKVSFHLRGNGYNSEFLIGDLPQRKRLRIISDFKEGKLPILVATDVAARGLHIEGLDLVVNYDLPGDSENYVHRIGRTARAGKSGKAISLACDDFIYNLDAIQEFIGIRIPTEPVDPKLLVRSKVSNRDAPDRRRGNNRRSSASGTGSTRRTGGGRSPSAPKRRPSDNSPKSSGKARRTPPSRNRRDRDAGSKTGERSQGLSRRREQEQPSNQRPVQRKRKPQAATQVKTTPRPATPVPAKGKEGRFRRLLRKLQGTGSDA